MDPEPAAETTEQPKQEEPAATGEAEETGTTNEDQEPLIGTGEEK